MLKLIKFHYMISGVLCCLLAYPAIAQISPGQQPASDAWELSVGTGVLLSPNYLGDDAYGVSAVPSIRVSYGDKFFASVQEGAGYNLINNEIFKAGPLVSLGFGRHEDGGGPFRITGDKTNDLLGLGDIDASIALGGFSKFDFGKARLSAQLTQAISGHDGLTGEISLSYNGKFRIYGPPVIYSAGPNVKFGDDTYMSAFFGVKNEQSLSSGLTPYTASAGPVSYGLSTTAIIPMTENVSVTLIAQYNRLIADAAQSSLVRERGSKDQAFVGLFTSYSFR